VAEHHFARGLSVNGVNVIEQSWGEDSGKIDCAPQKQNDGQKQIAQTRAARRRVARSFVFAANMLAGN
jgi:hypothetical protein